MSLIRWFGALVVSLALAGQAWASETGTRRFALVVGANDGGIERVKLRYAGTDAERVADAFRYVGGVGDEDLMVLLEPSRDRVLAALGEMRARVATAGITGRTELVLYYSGHSDDEGLLLAGEKLPYTQLRGELTGAKADVQVAILDSCSSGAMVRAKGGVRKQPFLEDQIVDVTGYAVLTSSSEDEAAQESDRIASSFFTHALVSGLRGAADSSQDGRVTLNELYQFAYAETLSRTERTSGGPQHPAFDIRLAGTGDLVMSDVSESDAGLVAQPGISGHWSLRDASGKLVVEVDKASDRKVDLALAPGSYVLLATDGPSRKETRFDLAPGQRVRWEDLHFFDVAEEVAVARGDVKPPVETPARPPEGTTFRRGTATQFYPDGEYDGFTVVNGIGILGHRAGAVEGFQWSQGWNDSIGDLTGAQLALGANHAGGDVTGAQLALGANVAGGSMKGAQMALGGNVAGGEGSGWQLALGANVAKGHRGLQTAVGANVRESGDGAQLAAGFNGGGEGGGVQVAMINQAKDLKGAQFGLVNVSGGVGSQFGLINVAKELRGEAIGLISVAGNGYNHGMVWVSETDVVGLGGTLGSRHFYTAAHLGVSPPLRVGGERVAPRLSGLIGLGVHIGKPKGFYVDLEALTGTWWVLEEDGGLNESDLRIQLRGRVVVGYAFFERFGIFLAPTINSAWVDDRELALDPYIGRPWASNSTGKLWGGLSAGVRF